MSLFRFRYLIYMMCLLLSARVIPANNDVQVVEKKVLDNRLGIKSWHVRFTDKEFRHVRRPDVPGLENHGDVVGRDFYRDKDKIRQDTFYCKTNPDGSRGDSATSISAWSNDRNYSFFKEPNRTDRVHVLTSVSRDLALKDLKDGAIPSTDIRLLGMVPFGTYFGKHELTSLVANPNRTNLSMVEESFDGVSCKKITFLDRRNVERKLWIDPQKGYSVIRIESDSDKLNFHNVTEVTVEKHADSGIWFPVRCVCEEKDNAGKRLTYTETEVEVVSFNKSLDLKWFEPISMGVPIGNPASSIPGIPGENYFWDGQKIVGENELVVPIGIRRGNAIRYLLIAMGLALICAGCVGKYLELSKNKRKPSGG